MFVSGVDGIVSNIHGQSSGAPPANSRRPTAKHQRIDEPCYRCLFRAEVVAVGLVCVAKLGEPLVHSLADMFC